MHHHHSSAQNPLVVSGLTPENFKVHAMVFGALNESLLYLQPHFLPLTFDCFLLNVSETVPPQSLHLFFCLLRILCAQRSSRFTPSAHGSLTACPCTHAHILPICRTLFFSIVLPPPPPRHITYRPQSIIHIFET